MVHMIKTLSVVCSHFERLRSDSVQQPLQVSPYYISWGSASSLLDDVKFARKTVPKNYGNIMETHHIIKRFLWTFQHVHGFFHVFLAFLISCLNLVPYSSTCGDGEPPGSGNESGLSSSLAFTPVQGIELVGDLGQTSICRVV